MESNYHLLGIEWKERKPYLVYRKDRFSLEETEIQLKNGSTFSLKILDQKHCIGYRDTSLHEQFLCKEDKLVWKKDLYQCFACRNHETVHFFSLAGLSEEQTEILRGKNHFNYLNLFGNDIVKVGVATEGGRWRRVLEQGADSTLFFTETDGVTAREIENFVSQSFEIRQAVTSLQKVKLLKELIPEKESRSKLLQTYFQIKLSIPEKYKQYLIDTPEFSYNDTYYQLSELEDMNEITFIDEGNTGDVFSGEIIGIPGQLLLYKYQGRYFALNMNKIKGFLVAITDKAQVNKISTLSKRVQFKKKEITSSLF